MASVPRPLVRRSISIPSLLVGLIVAVILTPLAVPASAVVDLAADRNTHFRRTRTWLLCTTALAIELVGLTRALALVVRSVGSPQSPEAQRRYLALELWWVARHANNLRRFGGLRWYVENPELVDHGGAVVVSRHASHADAILPALLFGTMGRLDLRYTLKDTLQWPPAMDIVGNRTPNLFIDRTPGPDSPVLTEIEALAGGGGTDTVTIIFPEGTFYTPERLHRAASRLAQTRPDLEATARQLRHLLPPRPAGTLALLRGAPDAAVVLVGHEGMDRFGSLADIARHIPHADPVRVRLWRYERHEVPTDEKDLVTWLLDRWLDIDEWISLRADERDRGRVTPELLATMKEIAP